MTQQGAQQIDYRYTDWKVLVRGEEDGEISGRGDITKVVVFSPSVTGNPFMRFSLYRAKPGLTSDLHFNEGDDIFYMIQGEMDLECDGEVFHVRAGQFASVKPAALHKARVVGDQEMVLISAHGDECPLLHEHRRQLGLE